MRKLWLCLLIIVALSIGELKGQKEPRFYSEIRPIQFVLNGFSFSGHYNLNDKVHLGGSIFSATLSDGITDALWSTSGAIDLKARQDVVLSLSVRYFLNPKRPNSDWYLGTAAGVEFYTLTNTLDNQDQDYTFYFLAPRLGYLWYPLKRKVPNLFVLAEAILVFPIIDDGEAVFDAGGTARINDILPSPLVGIGYRF